MDKEKKVTTSILEKNQEVKAFMIVQKEKKRYIKKAKHDYKESLIKIFEELETLIFETNLKPRTLARNFHSQVTKMKCLIIQHTKNIYRTKLFDMRRGCIN